MVAIGPLRPARLDQGISSNHKTITQFLRFTRYGSSGNCKMGGHPDVLGPVLTTVIAHTATSLHQRADRR
jgi:hypothetical protein